jgi:hypothetical protein
VRPLVAAVSGVTLGVPWLVTLGRDGTWLAFAAWVVVFVAMLASFTRLVYRAQHHAQLESGWPRA